MSHKPSDFTELSVENPPCYRRKLWQKKRFYLRVYFCT
jgi:hypothetical protein